MKLNEVKSGSSCRVVNVRTDKKTADRLKMLNVFRGSSVKVEGRSLLKKNLLVYSDGIRAAVRADTAEKITVESLD